MRTAAEGNTPVLLYDGECGLCAGSVQFVLGREGATARAQLRFAPLQGAFGASVRRAHPELEQIDSVVWFTPGAPSRVLVRSAAGLAVLRHLGGFWSFLGRLGTLVPRPLRDALYDQIARRRFTLAAPACLLPSPRDRSRFLS